MIGSEYMRFRQWATGYRPVPVKALAVPMNMAAETVARRDLVENMIYSAAG